MQMEKFKSAKKNIKYKMNAMVQNKTAIARKM